MNQGMQKAVGRLLMAAATIVVLAASTGCATIGRDLERDGVVTVERVSSSHAEVSQVQVRVHDGIAGIEIYGELRKRSMAPWTLPGHVEVQIVGPKDNVLEQVDAIYHRKDKRSRRVWFRVDLPVTPPPGSIVRVTHQPAV